MHWFQRPATRYTAPTAQQSPFARASQEWDNRIGSARVQAKNWRLMAFAAMGLSGVLAVCLTWLGAQSRVLTYVVELEKTGQPGRIQLASSRFEPSTAQVAYAIRKLVEQVRSVPAETWAPSADSSPSTGGRCRWKSSFSPPELTSRSRWIASCGTLMTAPSVRNRRSSTASSLRTATRPARPRSRSSHELRSAPP